MRIYRVFAENLRKECQRIGSVAELCRISGINRQQVNKYLAGQMMPTARTLQRLSESLGVPEEALFAVGANASAHSSQNEASGGHLRSTSFSQERENAQKNFVGAESQSDSAQSYALDTKRASAIENAAHTSWQGLYAFLRMEHSGRIAGFESGFYVCYFFLQNYSDFLVRSLMKVTFKDGMTLFTRHTYFDSPNYRKVRLAQGRNVGFAVASETEIYLLAKNRLFPSNVSLVTLQKDRPSGTNIYVGLCLTKGISQAFATRACVEYVGKSASCIAGLAGRHSIVPLDDPTVNPHVAFYMSETGDDKPGQISTTPTERLLMAAAGQTPLKSSQRPSRRAR